MCAVIELTGRWIGAVKRAGELRIKDRAERRGTRLRRVKVLRHTLPLLAPNAHFQAEQQPYSEYPSIRLTYLINHTLKTSASPLPAAVPEEAPYHPLPRLMLQSPPQFPC